MWKSKKKILVFFKWKFYNVKVQKWQEVFIMSYVDEVLAKVIEKNNGILLEETYIQEENSIFKKYKIVL